MTTNSYPALGQGGLTEAQWAAMYAGDDGVVEDYSANGQSLALSRNNSTDQASVAPGLVRVNGYTLEVTASHALSVPPVSTGTKVYTIAAQYDPALNVADGSGNRSALGPCRLIVTDAALDTSGGKQYVLLYTITRSASQVLTAAVVADQRRWVGPTITLPDFSGTEPVGFGPFPRGSTLIKTRVGGSAGAVDVMSRQPSAAGTALAWQSLTAPDGIAFPYASGLVAGSAGTPGLILPEGRWVNLAGSVKRSSNANLNNGSTITLGTLPVGYRPANTVRFVAWSSSFSTARIEINPNTGAVQMFDTGSDAIPLIELDNIRFRTV